MDNKILYLTCTTLHNKDRISLFYDNEIRINWYVIIGKEYTLSKFNGKTCIIMNEQTFFNNNNIYNVNLLTYKNNKNNNNNNNIYIKKLNSINDLYLIINHYYMKLPRFASLQPLYNYMAYFPPI